MGNLKLRKLIKYETTWIEKNTVKHKHIFTIPFILELTYPSGRIRFYNVLKCSECKSFKSIPTQHNVSGLILDELSLKNNN